jgi:hypothetical protein
MTAVLPELFGILMHIPIIALLSGEYTGLPLRRVSEITSVS